jgi:hypothetical protein
MKNALRELSLAMSIPTMTATPVHMPSRASPNCQGCRMRYAKLARYKTGIMGE